MTATPVRWGILGAAGINRAMAPAITATANAELVAIASRNAARAEAAAAEFGIPIAHDSYQALLADPTIEAVYIPLPNAFHCEWVIAAALAGKHVLCEKPMAVTADEARRMIAACADAGVLLAEAFMYVQHPRYGHLRELLDAGAIGSVRAIITTFSFDASEDVEHSGFRGYPGSGALYDVGCYAFHSARYLLGAEPSAITVASEVSELHGGIDMTSSGLLEFENGASLLFAVSMAGADTDRIEVIGSSGRVTVPHAFISVPGEDGFQLHTAAGIRHEAAPAVDHYVSQVERFSRAVRGEKPLLFDPGDALRNVLVLEAATASFRERRRVEIPRD